MVGLFTSLLLLPAGVAPASAHDTPSLVEAVCDGSLLLVDVPIEQRVPAHHAAASERVEARFEAHLTGKDWFTTACATVDVQLEDVFAQSPGLVEPRRHQRLAFTCGNRALSLRADRQCAAVDTLRTLFTEAYGDHAMQLGFARDCAASRQGPDARLPLGSTVADPAKVIVGVIDTPRGTMHGDAVEALIRAHLGEASAAVRVERIEAVSARRGTPTSTIAAAVGRFTADLPASGAEPVILNMSLGWPPELSQHGRLTGPSCEVPTAPIGEAVRSALLALKAKRTNSLIVAAAGNRTRTHGPAPADAAYGACGPQNAAAQLFFPAAWSRPAGEACGDARLRAPLVTAVGALNRQNEAVGAPRADVHAPGYAGRAFGSSFATATISGQAARFMASNATNFDAFLASTRSDAPLRRRSRVAHPDVQARRVIGAKTDQGIVRTGPVRTMPDVPICVGTSCFVDVDDGLAKVEVVLELTNIKLAPTTPYVIAGYFVIDDGTVEHEYALSATWQSGTFTFSDIVLPTTISGSSTAIQSADYWFRYKLDDGTTVDWYDDSLGLQMP